MEERTSDKELGDGDQTEDIGGEHRFDVGILDTADFVNTMNESSVIHCTGRAAS